MGRESFPHHRRLQARMRVTRFLVLFLVISIIQVALADSEDWEERKKKGKKGNKGKKGKGNKGKGNKGKGKGKGKKPRPPKPTVDPGAKFAPYTNGSNCECWFDITRTDCGCCKGNGVQCGDPVSQYCYKPTPFGCPGVANAKYTLSRTGHPCFWDHSIMDCAWCTPGGYQCGPGAKTDPAAGKNQCGTPYNHGYCEMAIADCRRMGKGICDVNADCLETTKNKWECKCNDGWKGNGLQCKDADGNFSQDPTKVVEVEMTLTNDFYVFPANSSEFPYGPAQDNLFSMMEGLMSGSQAACSGCNATMVTLGAPP